MFEWTSSAAPYVGSIWYRSAIFHGWVVSKFDLFVKLITNLFWHHMGLSIHHGNFVSTDSNHSDHFHPLLQLSIITQLCSLKFYFGYNLVETAMHSSMFSLVNYAHRLPYSPCVVANLWEVTDRDIDKYLLELLDIWRNEAKQLTDKTELSGFQVNSASISRAVSKSRDICKLSYLNGAAPVVYGLPVVLKHVDRK